MEGGRLDRKCIKVASDISGSFCEIMTKRVYEQFGANIRIIENRELINLLFICKYLVCLYN
jgi:hypothetical protein